MQGTKAHKNRLPAFAKPSRSMSSKKTNPTLSTRIKKYDVLSHPLTTRRNSLLGTAGHDRTRGVQLWDTAKPPYPLNSTENLHPSLHTNSKYFTHKNPHGSEWQSLARMEGMRTPSHVWPETPMRHSLANLLTWIYFLAAIFHSTVQIGLLGMSTMSRGGSSTSRDPNTNTTHHNMVRV